VKLLLVANLSEHLLPRLQEVLPGSARIRAFSLIVPPMKPCGPMRPSVNGCFPPMKAAAEPHPKADVNLEPTAEDAAAHPK
jgi:hypothetical protein